MTNPPTTAPHGLWDPFAWALFPKYTGSKSVVYRSEAGNIVAGAFMETGKATLTCPCDEFFIVTEGWIKLAIHGGETFAMQKRELIYLKEGTTVDFEFDDDFANVAIFISDKKATLC